MSTKKSKLMIGGLFLAAGFITGCARAPWEQPSLENATVYDYYKNLNENNEELYGVNIGKRLFRDGSYEDENIKLEVVDYDKIEQNTDNYEYIYIYMLCKVTDLTNSEKAVRDYKNPEPFEPTKMQDFLEGKYTVTLEDVQDYEVEEGYELENNEFFLIFKYQLSYRNPRHRHIPVIIPI